MRNTTNIFTFQDTITKILIYRMQEKKINPSAFAINYKNNRQRKSSNGDSRSLALMTLEDVALMNVLSHEKEEIGELLSLDKPSILILQKKIKAYHFYFSFLFFKNPFNFSSPIIIKPPSKKNNILKVEKDKGSLGTLRVVGPIIMA